MSDGRVTIDTELDSKGLQSGLSSLGGKVKKGMATVGKATAVGLASATAGVVALTKSVVNGYSAFEQNVGGIKKLYGNMGMSLEDYAKSVGKSTSEVKGKWEQLGKAQNMVLKDAKEAYKTAGMDANTYMETATQFSASLINSLGGDTVKASEQTKKAMVAMSDNINTFGSNAEDVQNAFKGFSKQNYTMLDNLKLGYGGTKTEMERLIADANEYAKSIGQAGNLSINSFSDIVDAIDLVQQKQQIAGTTAREASTTIEGSLNMTKSAWSNLVTAMGDPDADIGASIDALLDSASSLAGNLLPVIERALSGIGDLIAKLAPKISENIGKLATSVLPSLLKASVSLVTGLVTALPTILQALIQAIPTVFSSLMAQAPALLDAGKQMLTMIQTGITEGLPMLGEFLSSELPNVLSKGLDLVGTITKNLRSSSGGIVEAGLSMIQKLAEGISKSLPVLIQKLPAIVSDIAGIINDNAPKVLVAGVNIIITLAKGLIKAIPTLVANIPKILKAIWDVFMAFQWLNLGKTIITALKNGLVKAGPAVVNGAKSIGKAVINFFKTLPSKLLSLGKLTIKGLGNGIKAMAGFVRSNAGNIGKAIVNILKSLPSKLLALGKRAITFFANGIISVFGRIKSAVTKLGNNIVNGVKTIPSKMITVGSNIVKGLWNGINNMTSWVISKIKGFGKSVLDGLKSFFKIHSPSKRTEQEVGQYVALGVGVGITKATQKVVKQTKTFADKIAKAIVKGMTPTQTLAEKTVAIAQKTLDAYKKKHNFTLKEEEKFWKEYLKKVKKGTEAYSLVLAKISKVQARQAKAKEQERLDKILSSYVPTKSSAEKTVAVANKALKDFKSNHNLTLQEEENFWRRYRAKLKKNSEEYALVTKKIKNIQKQEVKAQKEAQKEKENSLVSSAESNLEKYKTYNDMSLAEEVEYWAKIVSQTTEGSDARYEADKKYLEAKKSLDEQIETLAEEHQKSIADINAKLAEDIDNIWQTYNDKWDENYNSMLTKLSLLDHITLKQGIGMDSLTQNIKEGNEATQDYLDLIDRIASNPIIPESLLEQIKSWGVENIATIREIANATPEALQAYVDEWAKREALASRYADSETAKLKEETEAKVQTLKDQATKDIEGIDKAYADGLEKLGVSLSEKGEVIGANIAEGVKTGVKSKKNEVETTTSKTVKSAVKSATASVDGKPIGQKIISDTVSAIKAGRGTIASTISSMVSSAVSSAIGEAQASIQSQAASAVSSNTATTKSTSNMITDLFKFGAVGTTVVNMTGTAYSPSQVMRVAKTEKRYAGI